MKKAKPKAVKGFVLCCPDGHIDPWCVHRLAKEVRFHAPYGAMGATEYENNSPASRWDILARRGYTVVPVLITPIRRVGKGRK